MSPIRTKAAALWASYNRALAAQPLLTKVATGVVGTIMGDALAQYSQHTMALSAHTKARKGGVAAGRHVAAHVEPPTFKYDFARLARLLVWSAAVGTPIAHFWFGFLDKCIVPGAPTSARAVAAKLLLDQGLMAPAGTALFFFGMKIMEGQPDKAVPEVKAKLWPVLCANWAVWPLANAINFALIPPSQRILYVNVLAVAWSAFMSHMAAKPAAAPAVAAGTAAGAAASTRGGSTELSAMELAEPAGAEGYHGALRHHHHAAAAAKRSL